jgi:hypothetical protein
MVAEQHKKIKGYRDLSMEEIDLMNRIKAFGPELKQLIDALNAHITSQYDGIVVPSDEFTRLDTAEPFRWIHIGEQNLQQGLMALTRAIAQPTFF